MKKVFALSLILALAVSSASFGAVAKKKTVTQVTTIKVQNPEPAVAAPAQAGGSGISVAPKLTMQTGDFNGMSVGVESYFFSPMPGVQLGAEGNYKLATNNVSWMQIGGIGRYMIPMEGQMFIPYVGGGLNYNLYSISVTGAGSSASGIGFKIFGGADFPVAGMGTFFANAGYSSQSFSYSYSYTFFGQTFSGNVSASGGGLYLEAGDRISL